MLKLKPIIVLTRAFIINPSRLAQSVVHRTLGGGVPGSIPVRSVVCCGLEQVTCPQLNVYSVHMFLNSRNKSSTELMLVVKI